MQAVFKWSVLVLGGLWLLGIRTANTGLFGEFAEKIRGDWRIFLIMPQWLRYRAVIPKIRISPSLGEASNNQWSNFKIQMRNAFLLCFALIQLLHSDSYYRVSQNDYLKGERKRVSPLQMICVTISRQSVLIWPINDALQYNCHCQKEKTTDHDNIVSTHQCNQLGCWDWGP